MFKAVHPTEDIDILYMSNTEGLRGFTSTEDRIDTSIRWLEDNIKKERLISTRNKTKHKDQQKNNNSKMNWV